MAYQPYRGSAYRRKHKLWIALLVLALLALIGTGIFFYLQEYIIFTSGGFRFSFSQPTPQNQQVSFTPPGQGASTPSSLPSGQPDPSKPEIPEPSDRQPITSALLADITKVSDEDYRTSLLKTLTERNVPCVAFTVLSQDGVCYLPTDSVYAEKSEALSPGAEELSGILAQLRAQDIRLAAVVSVCKNNLTPRVYRTGAIQTKGVTWLDHKYVSWFNPYQETVGAYLTDLLEACKNEGFTEVILDHLTFPVDGKTELIEYPAGQDKDREGAIGALAELAAEKADELGLTLCLNAYTGKEGGKQTGQSVSSLAPYFSVIYVSASGENDPSLKTLKEALQGTSCLPGASFRTDIKPQEDGLCCLIPFSSD